MQNVITSVQVNLLFFYKAHFEFRVPSANETPSEWWAKFLDSESRKACEQCSDCKDLRQKIAAIHIRSMDSKALQQKNNAAKKGLLDVLKTHRLVLCCL